jgi:hypothetical protein
MPLIAEAEHGTFYGVMGNAAYPNELKICRTVVPAI